MTTMLNKSVDLEQPLHDPFTYAVASRDADTLKLVRDSLAAGSARLAFQPVVLSRDPGQVAFYECLIRVLDSGGRTIPAKQFMPVVEEMDLGRQIDALSLQLAFKQLRQNPNVRMSVNVSARSFGDNRWRKVLEEGLSERGALGERLIFEISENSAMMLHEVVARFMEEMQPRGVAFALDGFGGGMISFKALKGFFFDLVKIDKSFAQGLSEDPDNQVLIEALITVAHRFEMFAVVEGIETAEDAKFIQSFGADCMQGFQIGSPRFELIA